MLLEQLNLTEEEAFHGCQLKQLEISKKEGTYHFYFSMPHLLEKELCFHFYRQLITRFTQIKGVNKVYFTAQLENTEEVDIYDYFTVVQGLLCIYDTSFKAIDNYEVKCVDKNLYIDIKTKSEQQLLESQFKGPIEKMYASIGLKVNFDVRLNENGHCTIEEINKRKQEQDYLFQQQLNDIKKEHQEETQTQKVVDKPYPYRKKRSTVYNDKVVGYPIKGESESILNIPLTQEDLQVAKVEYIIEGYIFECDSRKTAKGTHMIDFAITDYNDSITVKAFVKNEEHIEFYDSVFKKGNYVKLKGNPKYDEYRKEVILFSNSGEVLDNKFQETQLVDPGYNNERRVELHVHTNMSNMDSVTSISQYVERALHYQHEAIAITDHNGVYALPELYSATKNKNIKPIYGVEVNLVEDMARIAWNEKQVSLQDATYVVFDIETTGFSVNFDDIIEVSAVKIKNGQEIDKFSEFCNPHRKLSSITIELTNITDADLVIAREIPDVLQDFKTFCEDAILVAHNANFDMSHIENAYDKYGLGSCPNPVIDTLEYARNRFGDQLKRFNLKALSKFFRVDLTQHHRAIYDAKATAEIFIHLLRDMDKQGIKMHNEINSIVGHYEAYKYQIPIHVTLLAKNDEGLKNMFKIISDAHTVHFYREPRVTRSFLNEHRDNLFIGSSCSNGEVFKIAFEKSYEELKKVAQYYDYLEIQPPEVYSYLEDKSGNEKTMNYIIETLKTIIRCGNELKIPVVASGDVHHLTREDKLYREIYIDTPQTGGGLHPLKDPAIKDTPSMHFRTTEEMMNDFNFLPTDLAKEIIIDNPRKIASQIEEIQVIKDKLFTPNDDFLKDKGILSIDEELKKQCFDKAKDLYGENLPQYVKIRLEKELNSIIKHGFGVIYYISHMLVKKSLDDGYVVGSRGSVGSSFVATLLDITEVNPLSPHYRCPKCQFSSFKMNEEEKKIYPIRENETELQQILDKVDSGFDLPDAICPNCQTPLKKDGHDIPFETFLGFEGDKVPDIDLNFSGEYQPIAHQYCQEVFGMDYAFRAGTIGTVAEKTAFGFVRGYFEKRNQLKREPEIRRIAQFCQGVKRTTGQHPGGIIVVPNYMDIYDITPIQYPADNTENAFRTTHFDFHSIHDNLLKLDILGHDDPTMLRYLEDLTGIAPQNIPIDDKKVYQLFCSTESLGVKPERILSNTGSYGVPEFGTFFVRKMLEETRPKTFAELVKISGLSHGTDVWANNAQDLVNHKYSEFGHIDFKSLIGCRDDIMVYLMYYGLEPKQAFDIMEFVRKGKASKNKEKWEKYSQIMREKKVPEWFVWSCGQIKYMFPKAHATAYVLMAIRIAWFKVNMPIYYYAAYFSKRADTFDVNVLVRGNDAIRHKIKEINDKGYDATDKEKSLITILEIGLEMTERGFYFKQVDLEKSEASEFVITEDKLGLIIPFQAVDSLGGNVAKSIVEARKEKPFMSKEDLSNRTSLSKTLIERLTDLGCLDGLNDSNQISLFEL
ncbi:PolC-type DNA polymerase III [Mycoplasmatota bacterium]|nr:PolC-type DNA polymerase III [Mycoplasmatota bacterium]